MNYIGGAAGYSTATIADMKYLASGIYINEKEDPENDESEGRLSDAAIGNTGETTGNTDYSGFVSVNEINALLQNYIIRNYLLPTAEAGATVKITNWRQLSLITAYPFMSFEISANIYSPIAITTAKQGFYGVITVANDEIKVYAPIPSQVNIIDAMKDTTLIVYRDEKR